MTDPRVIVNRMQQALEESLHPKLMNCTAMDESIMDNETFVWSLDQLIDSVDGELTGALGNEELVFSSVSTDSRTLLPGALYIAIKGDYFEGHDYINEAVRQGAVAVLASKPLQSSVPVVLVENTRIALGQFARWHRRQMPVKKVVGITGSNGKTTVKSLVAEMFTSVGHTLATQGNFNNDLGVPRTLLEIRPEHEYAVIEMGANHIGEIEYLTKMVEPDIALLNNASEAHIEGFGSLHGVIQGKGEIFSGLNQLHKTGVAIINTDSPGFNDWQALLKEQMVDKVIRFGESDSADIVLRQVDSGEESINFELRVDGQWQPVTMPLIGKHNAMNAAACVGVGLAAGLIWQQIEPVLQTFTGVAGRLQRHKIANGWLIDDSYNANPGSVKAGIDALVSLPGKVALCLGSMAELGAQSHLAHEEIAEYAKHAGVSRIYLYGEATKKMPKMFGIGATWYKTHDAMIKDVKQAIKQEWVNHLLIKGSRSAKMETVVKGLLAQKA